MRTVFAILVWVLAVGPALAQPATGAAAACDALQDWKPATGAAPSTVLNAMSKLVQFANECLEADADLNSAARGVGLTANAETPTAARELARQIVSKYESEKSVACASGPNGGMCALWLALHTRATILLNAPPRRVDLDNHRVGIQSAQIVIGLGYSYEPPQPAMFLCALLGGGALTDQRNCESPLGSQPCAQSCLDAYQAATKALPAFRALEVAARMLTRDQGIDIAKWTSEANARWNNYLFGGDGAEPQPLWEIALNSAMFGYTDAERAGLPDPRSRQLVLMRPSLGVGVYDDDGTKAELAGVVEVLGYRQWKWGQGAKRDGEWGASLIAAYSPSESADDWGYGVKFKTPFLNGVDVSLISRDTDSDRETAIVFSVDISKIIPRTPAAAACGFFSLPGCTN